MEPLEGGCIFADPDEFNAAQALGRVGGETLVVDGFENRGPGCDADTCANQDGDFVLEDVFGGGTVRTVDAQGGHLLAVLQRDFVHAQRVELVVELALGLTGTKGVSKGASEVTDLADVDRDVRVVGAGCDGERMPLVVADFWAVQKQPLSGLVLHAGLGELDLDSVVRMANNLNDLSGAPTADLTVQAVDEIQTASDKLPSPALVTDAVRPEVIVVEGRESRCCITNEAARCVGVHAEQERDKEVVGVPEGFK